MKKLDNFRRRRLKYLMRRKILYFFVLPCLSGRICGSEGQVFVDDGSCFDNRLALAGVSDGDRTFNFDIFFN